MKLPRKKIGAAPAEVPAAEAFTIPYVRISERSSCWEYVQMTDMAGFMGTSVYIRKAMWPDAPERITITVSPV